MELIDILDKEGNKTGVSKTRQEVHKNGDWHRIIFVFVINSKNEVLLQHRTVSKDHYQNMWDISIGGHISSGEHSLEVAIREVSEEVGLPITEKDLTFLGTLKNEVIKNNGTYFDNEFSDVYVVKADIDINTFVMQESEVQGLRWVPIEDLKKMVEQKDPTLTPRYDQYHLFFKYIKN
jgi:isopentenyl-diphosphate Delta-isomerase